MWRHIYAVDECDRIGRHVSTDKPFFISLIANIKASV
jgi:hypothetical protein